MSESPDVMETSAADSAVPAPKPRNKLFERAKPYIGPLVIVILMVAVTYAIQGFLAKVNYADVIAAIGATPNTRIAGSLGAVALAFLALTGYDWSAMRYIGVKLPYSTIFYGSFCGYAIGNTAGFTLVTGGSVRYRIYSAAGLTASQIAIVTVFTMLTFGLGITLIGGAGLVFQPELVAGSLHGSTEWLRALGVLIVAGCVAMVALSYWRKAPITYAGLSLRLPSGPITLAQVGISALDMAFAALSLYLLLPNVEGLGFLGFSVVYCAAMMAGVSSHVPGGVGVFEAVVIFALKDLVPLDQLAAALVLWRCLYYFVPLIVAAIMLVVHEVLRGRKGAAPAHAGTPAADMPVHVHSPLALVPSIMAVLTFGAGIALLVATQTPETAGQLAWLGMMLPLEVIEASHLLSSVLGLVLLVLAHGLHHRLNAAYWLTALCLTIGIVSALAKGFDLGSAAALTLVLALLLPCRAEFHRPTSLLDQRPEPIWLAAVVASVIAALWLGNFAFRNLDYSQSQIWHFAVTSEAPRAARAAATLASLVLLLGLFVLLRPPRSIPLPMGPFDRSKLREMAAMYCRTLELGVESRVIYGPGDRAALVYDIEGRNWIAMGDPLGPPSDWPDLIWDFRERAEAAKGRPACRHISSLGLRHFAEAGIASDLRAGHAPPGDLADTDCAA
jgi:phosphatidylglycerol lysyltransferase